MKSFLIAVGLLLACGYAQAAAPPDIYYNDFESADMRFCNRQSDGICLNQSGQNGMVVMPPGEEPSQPAGFCKGTIGSGVCTGFVTFTDPGRVSIVNDPSNCHSGSWCMKTTLPAGQLGSSEIVGSGYTAGNITQGCTTTATAGNPTTDGCVSKALYYRFWLKLPTNFQLVTSSGSTTCQGKLLYMRAHNSPQPGTNDTPVIVFRSPNGSPLVVGIESAGVNSSAFAFQPDGLWHSWEVHMDFPNRHVQLWLDDVAKIDEATGPLYQQAAVDDNEWGIYINQNGTGFDNCLIVNTTSYFVDDLAVSTQRIGGGGNQPNIPGTPANLTVN